MRESLRKIEALYVLVYYQYVLKLVSEIHKILMKTLSLSLHSVSRIIGILFLDGYIEFKNCPGANEELRVKLRKLYTMYKSGPYIGYTIADHVNRHILSNKQCSSGWRVTEQGLRALREHLEELGLNLEHLLKKPVTEALKEIGRQASRRKHRELSKPLTDYLPELVNVIEILKAKAPKPPISVDIAPAKVVWLHALQAGIEAVEELRDERAIRFGVGPGLEFIADEEKVAPLLHDYKVEVVFKHRKERLSIYGFLNRHLINPLVTVFRAYTVLYPIFIRGSIYEEEIRRFLSRWYWPRVADPRELLERYVGVYLRVENVRGKRGRKFTALISEEIRREFKSVIDYFNRIIFDETSRAVAALGFVSSTAKRTIDVINASKGFATYIIPIVWYDLYSKPFPALKGKPDEDLKMLMSDDLLIAQVLEKVGHSFAKILLDADFYGSLAWLLRLAERSGLLRSVKTPDGVYLVPHSVYQRVAVLEKFVKTDNPIGEFLAALGRLVKSRCRDILCRESYVIQALTDVYGDKQKAEHYLGELYKHNVLIPIDVPYHGRYVLTPYDLPGLLLELTSTPLVSLLTNDYILPTLYKIVYFAHTRNMRRKLLELLSTLKRQQRVNLADYADMLLTPEGMEVLRLLEDLGLEHKGLELHVSGDVEKVTAILSTLVEALSWPDLGVSKEDERLIKQESGLNELDSNAIAVLDKGKKLL